MKLYLKKVKSRGVEYLYLAKEVLVDGKHTTKILEKFGRIDKIPAEKLKKIYDKFNNSQEIDYYLQKLTFKLQNDKDNSDTDDSNSSPLILLHYGHTIIKQLFDEYFNLTYKLNYIQSSQTNIRKYKISSLVFYLVMMRIMQPSSYLSSFNKASSFLASPITNVSLDNYYKTLDLLCEHKDEIMRYMYKHLSKSIKLKKPKLLFFDCTNFYFESPYDSREEFIMEYQNAVILRLMNKGTPDHQIQEYLKSEKYEKELNKAIQDAEQKDLFLRMRGPSKEGRFAQPITGIALVINEHGIPIHFDVFPGNRSEYAYLPKSVKELKEKYQIEEVFFVADRGLNSAANLDFLQKNDYGFIVAQKLFNLPESLIKIMEDEADWKTVDLSKGAWTVQLCQGIHGYKYRYKVADYTKTAIVSSTDENGKNTRDKIELDCKIIFTFSEKRLRRDLHSIDAMIAKAQEAIASGKFVSNPNSKGWKSLLKTKAELAQNKEDKEQFRAVALNQEKIDHLKRMAGYAALVFSPHNGNLSNITTQDEVYAQIGYTQLVSIEECFRVIKSTLDLRPVYVKTNEHIIGHCVVCMIALTLIKVIQYNLKNKGILCSESKLQEELNSLYVSVIPSGKSKYFFGDTRTPQKIKDDVVDLDSSNKPISSHLMSLASLKNLSTLESADSLRTKLKISRRSMLLTKEQLNILEEQNLKLTKTS